MEIETCFTTCMHTYIHTYMHAYIHACMHTCIYPISYHCSEIEPAPAFQLAVQTICTCRGKLKHWKS